MSSKAPPVVLVVWEDASAPDDTAWVANKDHDFKHTIFHTVGYLLHESKAGVTLSSSWSPDLVAGRDMISRKMIREMHYVRPPRTKVAAA